MSARWTARRPCDIVVGNDKSICRFLWLPESSPEQKQRREVTVDLDLGKIRLEINGIDEQLAKLFEQRMHLVSQVAEYKIQTGKAVFDPERERQNLERVGQYVAREERCV